MSDEFQLGAEHKTGRFPVLTNANFIEWLDLAEDVLLSKGLWGYVSGDIAQPTEPEKKTAFQKEDAKAVAFLKAVAGREQRAHLIGMKSSKAVLDKLKAVNQVSQQERVQSLLSQFHGFEASSTIDLTASRLTQLQHEIAAADPEERPSDTLKKAVLIQSLPKDYQSTVFALKAAGLSTMSFDAVVQRLKEVELALGDRNELDDLARAATGRNKDHKTKGRSKRNVECYHCHKKGHYQSECWELHGKPPMKGGLQNQHPSKGQQRGDSEETAYAWTASYRSAKRAGAHSRSEQQEWVLDSGCTRHMTYDRGHFVDFQSQNGIVTIADGKNLQVQGGGTIRVPIQGKMTRITGVIHVPQLGYNLLSVSQLADREMVCYFTSTSATLSREGERIATATRRGKSYILEAQARRRAGAVATTATETATETAAKAVTETATETALKKTEDMARSSAQATTMLWHRRLGHPGERKLQLIKEAVDGLPRIEPLQGTCETCQTTKSTTRQNRSPAEGATRLLERVHIDFWGPYKHVTPSGSKYMLTITDDLSRRSWVALVRERSAVYESFAAWKARAELESEQRLAAVFASTMLRSV